MNKHLGKVGTKEPKEIVDPFWGEDISILFRKDRVLEFFITQDQSTNERLNSVARFGIYVSIVLALYHKSPKFLTLSLLTFIITYFVNSFNETKETLVTDKEIYEELRTLPTINNPFGNNSVVDIVDNPKRPEMIEYGSYSDSSLKVKNDIEKAFGYNLYTDVGDLYGRNNSQRQYYTTPSRGAIPADPEGKLKQWLYGDGNKQETCKTNTYMCAKNILESPIRDRNSAGVFNNPNLAEKVAPYPNK